MLCDYLWHPGTNWSFNYPVISNPPGPHDCCWTSCFATDLCTLFNFHSKNNFQNSRVRLRHRQTNGQLPSRSYKSEFLYTGTIKKTSVKNKTVTLFRVTNLQRTKKELPTKKSGGHLFFSYPVPADAFYFVFFSQP